MVEKSNRQYIEEIKSIRRQMAYSEQQKSEYLETIQKLTETEMLYRNLAENDPDWTFWLNADNRLIYISSSSRRVTGYEAEEFKKDPKLLFKIILPEDRTEFDDHLRFAHKSKTHTEEEFRILNKDKKTRWISHITRPVYNADGEYDGLIASNRDITETKSKDDSSRDSQLGYRLLAENMNDVIWTMDPTLRPTYISPSIEQLLGYTVEEAMDQNLRVTLTSSSFQKFNEVWSAEMAQDRSGKSLNTRSVSLHLEFRRKDESTVWTECRFIPLRNDDKKIIEIIGVCRDISDAVVARENLNVSETKLQQNDHQMKTLLDAATESIYLTDTNGKVLFANETTARRLGTDLRILMTGGNIYDFFPPDTGVKYRQHILQAQKTNKPVYFHDELLNKIIAYSAYPVAGNDGKVTEIAVFGLDITDRQTAEASVQECIRKLAQAERLTNMIINAAPVRIYWKDKNSVYLGCNYWFAKDAGRKKPDDLIGDTDKNMAWGSQAEQIREEDLAVMNGKESRINREELQISPDGKQIWLLTTKIPLTDAEGRIIGIIGTYQDITEYKSTQEKLAVGEKKLREKEKQLREGQDQLIETSKKLEETQNQLQERERKLREDQNQLGENEKQLHENQNKLNDISHRFQESQSQLQEREQQLRQAQNRLDEIEKQLHENQNRFGDTSQKFQETQSLLKEREQLLRQTQSRLDENEKQLRENQNKLQDLEKHLRENQIQLGESVKHSEANENRLKETEKLLREAQTQLRENDKKSQETNSKLMVSEKQLLAILNASMESLFLLDPAGKVLYANETTAQRLNTDIPTLYAGRTIFDFIPAPAAEKRSKYLAEIIKNGRPTNFEDEEFGKTISYSIYPINGQDGKTFQLAVFGMDITDRKTAEQAAQQNDLHVHETNRILQQIIDAIPIRIFWKDQNSVYLGSNHLFALDAGRDNPDSLIGQTDRNLVSSKLAERYRQEDQEVIKSRKSKSNTEELFTTPAGKKIWIRTTKAPLSDGEGKVIGVLGMYDDITEQKKTGEEVAANEKYYQSFFENNYIPVLLVDPAGGAIVDANLAACSYFGWSRKELTAKKISDITMQSAREIGKQLNLAAKQKNSRFLLKQKMADGSTRDAEVFSGPLSFHGRSVLYCLLYDVTGRAQMEQPVGQADKLDSLGILAGGIAHDFNNLMTIVQGHIDVALLTLPENDFAFTNLQAAQNAVEKTRDITTRLITLSKGGTPVLKVSRIDNLLDAATVNSLKSSDVELVLNFPGDLWPAEVDRNQIRQCFSHLVDNAREAMPDGGNLTISGENVYITEADALPLIEGPYLKIAFEDSGKGIPQEQLARIFDPYYSTKPMAEDQGMGLGLAVCHSVLKKHGGYITVNSEEGHGAIFSVYLPAKPGAVVEEEPAAVTAPPAPKRILIMDDNADIRKILQIYMEKLGFEVTAVAEGQEVIRQYREAKETDEAFAAVFMEISVKQGLGGEATLSRLKNIDPDVKAVAILSEHGDSRAPKFLALGFKDVLGKPFRLEDMKRILSGLLDS